MASQSKQLRVVGAQDGEAFRYQAGVVVWLVLVSPQLAPLSMMVAIALPALALPLALLQRQLQTKGAAQAATVSKALEGAVGRRASSLVEDAAPA